MELEAATAEVVAEEAKMKKEVCILRCTATCRRVYALPVPHSIVNTPM
jgi:hypothetical protein